MEPIFTLSYSEFEVINQIQKFFKKNEGYSTFIPTNRQQKGVDFIILNCISNKILKVQVKGSSYHKSNKRNHYLWFNNFIKKYQESLADVYFLFGLYPEYRQKENIRRDKVWKSIIFAFEDKEMKSFLDKVITKKERKKDKMFGVAFNNPSKPIRDRGPYEEEDLSQYLLENKINDLKNRLK